MPTPIGRDQMRDLLAAGAQLVEVLPAAEYEDAHLPDARHLPLGRVTETGVAGLDRARPVVVYCWDSL